jgi:hypothetical protein
MPTGRVRTGPYPAKEIVMTDRSGVGLLRRRKKNGDIENA